MYEIPHITAAKKNPIPTTTPYPTPTGRGVVVDIAGGIWRLKLQ